MYRAPKIAATLMKEDKVTIIRFNHSSIYSNLKGKGKDAETTGQKEEIVIKIYSHEQF